MKEISCRLLVIGAGPGGYVCAIRAGQLGVGDFSPRATPLVVRKTDSSRLDGVVGLSTLSRHTCALGEDGTVRCWGRGLDMQLGDGQSQNRAYATVVSGYP